MVRAEGGGETTPPTGPLQLLLASQLVAPRLVQASGTADPGVGVGGHGRGTWRTEGQDTARAWSQVTSSHVAATLAQEWSQCDKEGDEQAASTDWVPALRLRGVSGRSFPWL